MNISIQHFKKESGITLSRGKISVEGSEERRKLEVGRPESEDGSWKSEDRRAKTEVGSRKTEGGVGTVAMESARETVSRPKGRKTEVTNN